jgi:perosamine synthetase
VDRIPVARPDLGGNEERYVVEAVRSSWISSTGAFVTRFEREFAALCGTTSAIAVSNGTIALHLALLALGVEPGDEVIVPSLTFVATANAVRYVGAEPVFVDIDPGTWCLDPAMVAEAVTPRTKGIIAVHVYGHPADMDAINDVAARHGLWVVEDAAEAHLALYKGRTTGGLGTIGTFSFFGNKILTTGEGGALTLSDPVVERTARMLRDQGMDPDRRYWFPVVGYNFRTTNVACAIGCAQLERAAALVDARRRIVAGYRERLAAIEGIGFQPVAPWAEPAPWLFSATVDAGTFGRTRDELMTSLDRAGIETRPLFIPLHTLPPYRATRSVPPGGLPITEAVAARGLNLPTFPGLGESDLDRIAAAIAAARGSR